MGSNFLRHILRALRVYITGCVSIGDVSRLTFQAVKAECFFFAYASHLTMVSSAEQLAINHVFFAQLRGSGSHLCVDMTYFLAKSTPTKLMWSPWWLKTNVDLPRIVVLHSVISFVTHSAPLPLRPGSNFLFKLTFSRAPLPIGS